MIDPLSSLADISKYVANPALRAIISSMPNGKGPKLLQDIKTNKALSEALEETPELTKAWDILDEAGYLDMKKLPASLKKLNKLLTNPKLAGAGLDENLIKRLIKGNRGTGAVALDQLTKGLDELVEAGTKFDDIAKLAADLEKGSGFAEGARWIQRAITENVDEFAGKTLKFEEVLKAGENLRRVDVRVKKEGLKDIFYEFKSVTEIPPANFAKQFVNDMNLSEVTDLDQLKWVFDGKKIKDLFVEGTTNFKDTARDSFIDAIENANISNDVINKLVSTGPKTKDALIDLIEDNFNSIFQVK